MAKTPRRAMTATNEEVEAFLKGTNPQEHIIKIECDFNDEHATVIWRDENFQKHYTKEPFYPFCWAKQEAGRQMFGGNREILKLELQTAGIECKGLAIANSDGDVHPRMQNGYNVMFHAIRPMSNQQFQKFFDKADVPIKPKPTHPTHGKNYYKTVAPNEQFMIETGKRLFKGYESYDDLLRMQFDIETSGLDPKKDTLDQIGCRTNKGFEKIITVEGETPEEYFKNAYNAMLEFYEDIAEIDPDIISGYNSENFDWNFFDIFSQTHYDETLAEMSKSPKLSRGIYKRKQETVLKLGGEVEYYKPTVCWGKHITDCLFSVRRAQALDSNMKKATLKYVTKYAGIEKKNRVYVPGNLIHKTWKDTNVNYAFNDEDGKWFEITEKNLEKHYYSKKLIDTIIEPQTKFGVEWISDEEYEVYQKTGVLNLEDVEVEYTINKVEKINLYDDYYCVKYSYIENVEKNIYEDVDEGLKYTKFDDHIIDNETGGTYQFVTGQYIVKRYLLDDLWETDKVELRFNESNFLVGKMLPVNFERMCTMGTATIWKYIMLAWSYEHELAIPDEISSRSFTGGLSRLLTVGYIPNVQKLDYNSLYPSIILTFGIKTKVDISGAMPAMLEYILTNREFYKDKKAEWDDKATELEKYLKVLKSDKEMSETEFNALPEVQQIIEDIKIAKANKIRNDKLQLPLKITANAFFGSFGAGGGIFNWSDMDCAEETTCCGRQMLRLMLHWFSQKGYQGIVCDSVTGDTPLFIRYRQSNNIDIKPIESLFGINQQNVEILEDGREYDYNDCQFDVLCRSGWQKPKFLYRHKTDKDVYRVEDNDMSVDCTKDHSLFNDKQEEIKPTEIKEDTKLEYYKGETIYTDFNTQCVNENYIKFIANTVKNGICTELPVTILNLDIRCKKIFLSLLNNVDININTHTKTLVAGIQYLQNCVNFNITN